MRTRSPRVVGLVAGLAAIVACLVVCAAAGAQPGPPRLTIAPGSAQVGSRITVNGYGFRPRLRGFLLFGGQRVASFRAGPKGKFRVRFAVPAGGSRRLRVVGEQSMRDRHGSIRRLRRAAIGFQVVRPNGTGNAVAGEPLVSPVVPAGSVGSLVGSGASAGATGGSLGGSGGSTGSSGGGSSVPESPQTPEAPKTPESPKGPEGSKGTKGAKRTKGAGGTGGTGGTEGTEGTEGSGGGTSGSWWIPPQKLTWYWQLQGTVNNNEPVAAYDIDGFDNTAAEVAALHGQSKHVICYIDVGTYEPGRSDSSAFPTSVRGSGVQGWPGEQWLDISNLSVLEPIMTARFQMCKEKGFDAVEPDNMDGFENGSGFPLTAAEQVTYDTWVAGEVHSLGMAVFQKNDGEQTAQLESHFDGALDEQCNQYSECSNFQAYLTAGKPVLNAEYELSTSAFCAADNAAGIMGARYALELDGSTFEPCW